MRCLSIAQYIISLMKTLMKLYHSSQNQSIYAFQGLLLFSLHMMACTNESSTSQPEILDAMLQDFSVKNDQTIVDLSTTVDQCISEPEVCDALDNDCDGTIDEDFVQLGQVCSRQLRSCVSEGIFTCTTQGSMECNAVEIQLQDEVCDTLDNDCDGSIDEGFNLEIDSNHCGQCDQVCEWNQGSGVCRQGVCQFTACIEGWQDGNQDLSDGCECNEGNRESCDGLDNDCDGQIDEDFSVGRPCEDGIGACKTQGEFGCIGMYAAACQAVPGMPSDELCDGLDNDCDAVIDEDFDSDEDGSAACDFCVDCDMMCDPSCINNDCDPNDPLIHPYAWDTCEDGIDQNCDGVDPSCVSAYARASSMQILAIADSRATCPDQNGDGIGDNSFAVISGIANPSMQNYIDINEMNILIGAYNFNENQPEARFSLAVLLGRFLYDRTQPNRIPEYYILPSNYDELDLPIMRFPFTQVNQDSFLEGGPGDFVFTAPFNDMIIEVPIEDAYIKGNFSINEEKTKFSLTNGLVSGRIDKNALTTSLILLDADIIRSIESLLTADIDADGDGVGDKYSVCLRITLSEVIINHDYVPPIPEP